MSSDANHYGMDFDNAPFGEDEPAHRKATGQDVRIAESCIAEDIEPPKIFNIQMGMGTTAPFSLKHWVGYLSAAFYLKH